MTLKKLFIGFVASILLLALLVLFKTTQETSVSQDNPVTLPEPKDTYATEDSNLQSDSNDSALENEDSAPPEDLGSTEDFRIKRFADGTVHYNPSVDMTLKHGTYEDVYGDLGALDFAFTSYRLFYKENPAATDNEEFTAMLMGNNPKSVFFISPESEAVSGDKLVDRWGTPYFFHLMSAVQVEIISGGPDKELWTEDDIKYLNTDTALAKEFQNN